MSSQSRGQTRPTSVTSDDSFQKLYIPPDSIYMFFKWKLPVFTRDLTWFSTDIFWLKITPRFLMVDGRLWTDLFTLEGIRLHLGHKLKVQACLVFAQRAIY